MPNLTWYYWSPVWLDWILPNKKICCYLYVVNRSNWKLAVHWYFPLWWVFSGLANNKKDLTIHSRYRQFPSAKFRSATKIMFTKNKWHFFYMMTHFFAPFFGSDSSSGCNESCRVVSSFNNSSNNSVTFVPFLADVSMYLHFHIDWK